MKNPDSETELFYLIFLAGHLNKTITCSRGLFSTDNKDFDQLLLFAPEMFGLFQDALRDRTSTLFGKILDRTKGTLSLHQWINTHVDQASRAPYLKELKEIEKEAKPILDIRHNAVSHTNREFASGVKTLAPVEYSELVRVSNRILDLMKKLRDQYFPDIGYSIDSGMQEDVSDFMDKIKAGNSSRSSE